MMFFSGMSMAETTNLSPTPCNPCQPGESATSTNGIAIVSKHDKSTCSNQRYSNINGKIRQRLHERGINKSLYSNLTNLGIGKLSTSQHCITSTAYGTFIKSGCQLVILSAISTPTTTKAITWSTNATSAGSVSAIAVTAETPSYTFDECRTFLDVNNLATEKKWMDKKKGVCKAAITTYNAVYRDFFQPIRAYQNEFYSFFPNPRWVKSCNESH